MIVLTTRNKLSLTIVERLAGFSGSGVTSKAAELLGPGTSPTQTSMPPRCQVLSVCRAIPMLPDVSKARTKLRPKPVIYPDKQGTSKL
jgi:hypothetical protein